MYVYVEFPRDIYHPGQGVKTIHTPDGYEAGWFLDPDCTKPAVEFTAEAPTAQPSGAPDFVAMMRPEKKPKKQ